MIDWDKELRKQMKIKKELCELCKKNGIKTVAEKRIEEEERIVSALWIGKSLINKNDPNAKKEETKIDKMLSEYGL